MTYLLEFTLIGLPHTTNSGGRAHWAVKGREAKQWRDRAVFAVIAQKAKPKEPLKKAKLTLTRCSSGRLDYDGLVSSFKHVIDGLVVAGVLIDDNEDVVGVPEYRHEKAAQGQGKIMVKVEGV